MQDRIWSDNGITRFTEEYGSPSISVFPIFNSALKSSEEFLKRSAQFLGEMLILGLEQHVVSENKVLKIEKDVGRSKGHWSHSLRVPNVQSWKNVSNKINNIVLGYTLKIK